MTASSTKTRALCVATRCTSVEQFVATFHRFCGDDETFFVATMTSRPIGLETPFSIQLADKQPVLRGMCIVLDAWETPENRYRRPGIRLGIKRLTADSQLVFDRLKAAASRPPASHVEATPPPGPAPLPSIASGSRPPAFPRRGATPPPLPPLSPRGPSTGPLPRAAGTVPGTSPPPVPPAPPPASVEANAKRPLPSVPVPPPLDARPALPTVTIPPLTSTPTPPSGTVVPPPLPSIARTRTPPVGAKAMTPPPAAQTAVAEAKPAAPAAVAEAKPAVPVVDAKPAAVVDAKPAAAMQAEAPPTALGPPPGPRPIEVTRFQVALHVDTIPPPINDVEFKPRELMPRKRIDPKIISEPSPGDAPVDAAQPALIVDRPVAPPPPPVAAEAAPRAAADHATDPGLPEPRDTMPMLAALDVVGQAAADLRTPGSALVLPANPLQDLSDESIEGFVDCTLYEETDNIFHPAVDGPEWADDGMSAAAPPAQAPEPPARESVPAMPFDAAPNLTVRALGNSESLEVADDPGLTRTASGELPGVPVPVAADDPPPEPELLPLGDLAGSSSVAVAEDLLQSRWVSGEMWSETVRRKPQGAPPGPSGQSGVMAAVAPRPTPPRAMVAAPESAPAAAAPASPRTQRRPDTPLPRPATNVPLDLGGGPDPASWFDSVSLPYSAGASGDAGALSAVGGGANSAEYPAMPGVPSPGDPSIVVAGAVAGPAMMQPPPGLMPPGMMAPPPGMMAAMTPPGMTPPGMMAAMTPPGMMAAMTPPGMMAMTPPGMMAMQPPPMDPSMAPPPMQHVAPMQHMPPMQHVAPIQHVAPMQHMPPTGPGMPPMGYPMGPPMFDPTAAGPHGAPYPQVDGARLPRAADLVTLRGRLPSGFPPAWQRWALIGGSAVVAILLAFGLARLIRGARSSAPAAGAAVHVQAPPAHPASPAPSPAASSPAARPATPSPAASAPSAPLAAADPPAAAGAAAPGAADPSGADGADGPPDDDGEAVAGGSPVVGSGPCRFTVATTPAGSVVRLDDTAMGPSPITIDGSCDKHKVDVSHARYQSVTKYVTLIAEQPQSLDINLPRPIHAVTVTSFPPGAELSIDGHRAGTTPTVVQMTGFATVNLMFTKAGFQSVTRKVYSKVPQDHVFVKLMK